MWFCARSRSQPTMPRLGLFFCLLVLHCDLLLHCCLECLYCAFFVAFVSFRKAPKPSESSAAGSTPMLRLVVLLCLHLLLACFALRFTFALLLGIFVLCFFRCDCFLQKRNAESTRILRPKPEQEKMLDEQRLLGYKYV